MPRLHARRTAVVLSALSLVALTQVGCFGDWNDDDDPNPPVANAFYGRYEGNSTSDLADSGTWTHELTGGLSGTISVIGVNGSETYTFNLPRTGNP